MNTIIEADAAKLAGLQIDLLQKMRQGQITTRHLEWFIRMTKDEREAKMLDTYMAGTEIGKLQKFALLVDLGTITVPDDYVHGSRLTTFGNKHRKEFYYYNDEITDGNFPNPTRVLKPGDKLRVRAFKQVVSGETTSEERMAFLATQKAVLVGAQGASLVYEQKRNQLPKGKWYVSFDEKDRLWEDAVGDRRVPSVYAYSDGAFIFGLGGFERPWSDDSVLLCFCDE